MPRMPNLPRECVARSHLFEYTGIDYFGPLYVKISTKFLINHLNKQRKGYGSVYLHISLLEPYILNWLRTYQQKSLFSV